MKFSDFRSCCQEWLSTDWRQRIGSLPDRRWGIWLLFLLSLFATFRAFDCCLHVCAARARKAFDLSFDPYFLPEQIQPGIWLKKNLHTAHAAAFDCDFLPARSTGSCFDCMDVSCPHQPGIWTQHLSFKKVSNAPGFAPRRGDDHFSWRLTRNKLQAQ